MEHRNANYPKGDNPENGPRNLINPDMFSSGSVMSVGGFSSESVEGTGNLYNRAAAKARANLTIVPTNTEHPESK